ncbi:MAG: hypothetical protein ABI878_00940 [Acidobacteriota bacterium]
MKQVLYGVARSEMGELIHAVDADKGGVFSCGFRKDPLVLKKSGKTGIGSKRPHFAHKSLTPNCNPESALHFEFKTMLVNEIKQRLDGQDAFPISWKCIYCFREHSGDLIKKTRRVALEHSLSICRPDISLFDDDGRVYAVIEAVVTHAPDNAVKDYYRMNGITLIELHLDSDAVLNDVSTKLSSADHVQLCPDRKRCRDCGHFQEPIEMKLVEAPCYGCNTKMKVPFIEGDHSRGSHIGPDQFSQKEMAIAREHGAQIEWQYSSTLDTKYWATTCGRCKKFIGRNLLFTEYIVPATFEGSEVVSIELGGFCSYCEVLKSAT